MDIHAHFLKNKLKVYWWMDGWGFWFIKDKATLFYEIIWWSNFVEIGVKIKFSIETLHKQIKIYN